MHNTLILYTFHTDTNQNAIWMLCTVWYDSVIVPFPFPFTGVPQ